MFLNAPIDVRISILGIHPMVMLHVSNLVNDGISLIQEKATHEPMGVVRCSLAAPLQCALPGFSRGKEIDKADAYVAAFKFIEGRAVNC